MKSLTKKLRHIGEKFETWSCKLVLTSAMLSLFSCSAIPANAEASQVELQRGIQSFNSKHYSDAVGHLQQYVAAAPHESIGHYYLANCLFNLGYQKPCLAEYTLALKESTSQKMTDYCRDAIRSMQASKQIVGPAPSSQAVSHQGASNQIVSSQSAAGQIASSTPTNVQGQGYDASEANQLQQYGSELEERIDLSRGRFRRPTQYSIPGAPYPTKVPAYTATGGELQDLALEKTLVRMTDQSNVEIATLQRNYAADLESLKQHLSDDIFRLNRERDVRIQALQDGVRLKGSSSSDTVDSIKKDTASKITAAQSTYDSTTKQREEQFLEQVAKMQNALRVSQDQVADARRGPGNHPNLQLAGTDLYTRNFIPSPNPPPPDELVATPERLVIDAHSRPGRTISRVVRDPVETPVLPLGADLKVHGQLVK
ncbi:MAG: hypothetical protein JST89_06750 [Cyanobacteria bacterium SZAS-4]|nr:hypothetical protein [Cyanobacteria bacterium SZAS-4]